MHDASGGKGIIGTTERESGTVSRGTHRVLVPYALASTSLLLLLVWFMTWDLPAGPEILKSPLLVISLVFTTVGIAMALAGGRGGQRKARTIVAVAVCIVAGAPSAVMLVIALIGAMQ